jgi:hypothetical protein
MPMRRSFVRWGAALVAGSLLGAVGLPARATPGGWSVASDDAGMVQREDDELPAAITRGALVKSFAKLDARTLTGKVGLAVTPCARGGKRAGETMTFGKVRTGPAWSTSKVLVAVAALNKQDTRGSRELARSAITWSDNESARLLRRILGGSDSYTKAMAKTLRNYYPRAEIPEFPLQFGFLEWSLESQAVFMGGLAGAKDPQARHVLELMGEIVQSHRWGLGKIEAKGLDTAFKGGWYPWGDQPTSYQVRQMGVIRSNTGCWAVAMASFNDAGFAAATSDLNAMARWVRRSLDKFPAGKAPTLP